MLTTGTNTATSAWRLTGLYPFNPFCTGWTDALTMLGPLNKEMKKQEGRSENESKNYEVQAREIQQELTDEEETLLTEGFVGVPAMQAAYFVLVNRLSAWRDEQSNSPSTTDKVTTPPAPATNFAPPTVVTTYADSDFISA